MSTSKDDISGWFDRGVAQGATHMIVVCDTFDHDDYPVFANDEASALAKYKHYNGQNMQIVMEVYDLLADKSEQMNEFRAMRLPAQKTAPASTASHP